MNLVLFGPPGRAYVYLIYGNHFCLNVSCLPEGQAGCVLLRALEPQLGIRQMARARGISPAHLRLLASGPGRLAQALGITRPRDNGQDGGHGRHCGRGGRGGDPGAGPAGAEERWDSYRHDSGTSVSWAWREAPRQNVTSDVLARLLGPGAYPKRVALQYRPLPAAAAARSLDNEVRAAEFRHEYSRRTRRDVTARDLHDHARARQAADEEARGAGVSLLGLYVTVTVTDSAELPRAVADTEAAAEASRIRLQRLYRSQAAAFTATLPCGICLPELARRLRH